MRERYVNTALLGIMAAFIFYYFKPSLLFLETITAGGDTASHYYPAQYMKDVLLPNLKVVGWSQGWFAGMPMFRFYFPLTYVFMVLLAPILSLQVSFKLLTILGTLLLPVCTFFSMRYFGFRFPVPIIASGFTLPFLFMEANSMWGGNIPSTLAGEFSYSLSLSLSILFLGTLFWGTKSKKWIPNAVLFSLVVLSHAITALWVFLSSLLIVFYGRDKPKENAKFMMRVYTLSFALSAFWLVPLLIGMPFTTPYGDTWDIQISSALPSILYPFILLSGLSAFFGIREKDKRIGVLIFSSSIALLLTYIAEPLGLVNIRFIPFFQLLLVILASYSFYKVSQNKEIISILAVLVSMMIVLNSVSFIPVWIKWNYSGFEDKPLWAEYKEVNDFLSGDYSDTRVVYEHSDIHDRAGSVRAYESLPLFSGRSTLEGLFMQSSVSSPFIFYIQSEVSDKRSCPFWRVFPCTEFNMTRGIEHMELFNVGNYIATSQRAKRAARDNLQIVKTTTTYEVYDVPSTGYVVVPDSLEFEDYDDWKQKSYDWFRYGDLSRPIVFDDSAPSVDVDSECQIEESVGPDYVEFNTSCPEKPHIVRITYNPDWKSENGEKIYLVSPSFMLIYPESENTRMYFGQGLVGYISKIVSILSVLYVIYLLNLRRIKSVRRT